MAVTTLVSAKSCGVTTSALAFALASRRPSLLAECDPAGGTLRAGFLNGDAAAGFGLFHLAAAQRSGPEALSNAFVNHLWPLDEAGHRKLLPGLTDPAQASALGLTWPRLSDVLHILSAQAGYDVFVDAGRLALDTGHLHEILTPAPLIHQADQVLLVVRGTEQSLSLARHMIDPLRTELRERGSGPDTLGLLLIEGGLYRAHQVGDALKTPVLATLPWDQVTAEYFATGGRPPRGHARSPLLRHARTATEQIEAAVSRRRIQQEYPARRSNPQLTGVLQHLAGQRGGNRG
ncbi:hypothetical protein [Streptomyces sp. NPDC056010]|uniref:hypothetical protein n=1 Tax=Streptomyces sp. NPDC056010 TaxID=3345679 RepID=UPI0035E11A18